MKSNIKSFTLDELKNEMIALGEKVFRAEQIFKWLHQENVQSFEEMTNISKEFREVLNEKYTINNFKIIKKLESKDGTKKYLFDILDGNAIESVLMQYKFGYSICVSSQVGCKMGCKFCASTGIPFSRNFGSISPISSVGLLLFCGGAGCGSGYHAAKPCHDRIQSC